MIPEGPVQAMFWANEVKLDAAMAVASKVRYFSGVLIILHLKAGDLGNLISEGSGLSFWALFSNRWGSAGTVNPKSRSRRLLPLFPGVAYLLYQLVDSTILSGINKPEKDTAVRGGKWNVDRADAR